jgi:hypothetical protein
VVVGLGSMSASSSINRALGIIVPPSSCIASALRQIAAVSIQVPGAGCNAAD